ncbi:MAG TPA: SRPBCC family protein [Actinomycetota bacterium]|nr:SRPBCC family protein [Actinomycetota bacterium]
MSGQAFAVDRSAPVVAGHSTDVAASAEVDWDVLTAVAEWPRWNPAVKAAALTGPVAEGSSFEWKAGPGSIRSVLRVVDRPRRLGWTGKTLGIAAVHVYTLEPTSQGTKITTEESWDGPLSVHSAGAFGRRSIVRWQKGWRR